MECIRVQRDNGLVVLIWGVFCRTDLYPVGEPVALRIRAFHGEEDVSSWNHTSLWHSLDLNGQMAIIPLHSDNIKHSITEHLNSRSTYSRFNNTITNENPRWVSRPGDRGHRSILYITTHHFSVREHMKTHLKDVVPAFLVEHVILKVFSVHLPRLTNLRRGHDLPCQTSTNECGSVWENALASVPHNAFVFVSFNNCITVPQFSSRNWDLCLVPNSALVFSYGTDHSFSFPGLKPSPYKKCL